MNLASSSTGVYTIDDGPPQSLQLDSSMFGQSVAQATAIVMSTDGLEDEEHSLFFIWNGEGQDFQLVKFFVQSSGVGTQSTAISTQAGASSSSAQPSCCSKRHWYTLPSWPSYCGCYHRRPGGSRTGRWPRMVLPPPPPPPNLLSRNSR